MAEREAKIKQSLIRVLTWAGRIELWLNLSPTWNLAGKHKPDPNENPNAKPEHTQLPLISPCPNKHAKFPNYPISTYIINSNPNSKTVKYSQKKKKLKIKDLLPEPSRCCIHRRWRRSRAWPPKPATLTPSQPSIARCPRSTPPYPAIEIGGPSWEKDRRSRIPATGIKITSY